jgi:hypothetical protein
MLQSRVYLQAVRGLLNSGGHQIKNGTLLWMQIAPRIVLCGHQDDILGKDTHSLFSEDSRIIC